MAVPAISTTISDGYRRGFDRFAATAPSALVPALVVGVVVGAIAQAQLELTPDVAEAFSDVLAGRDPKLHGGERATFGLLGAVSSALQLAVALAGVAVFGGALHRERHDGETADVPGPGAILPAMAAAFGRMMPKILVLPVLVAAPSLASAVSGALAALVTLVSIFGLAYFGVRWAYAPVIAGSDEGDGDEAFARSEHAVDGSYWPTFGTLFVAMLAIGIPVGIVGQVVAALLPGTFLSALGSATVMTLGALTLTTAALESAWAQAEGGDDSELATTDHAHEAQEEHEEPRTAGDSFFDEV